MPKILLVEDEKDIREIYKRKLQTNGYDVAEASNGLEAISIYKTFEPDLVLMDIVMPHMDGYETSKKLKEEFPKKNLKVLFITAKDLEPKGILERCKETEACGYVNKLTDFNDILKLIHKLLM